MNKEVKVDIKALANLARLELSDEEVANLEKSIPDILAFVEQIQKADVTNAPVSHELRNVTRADENPHESGIYTKKLLDAAPAQRDDQIVVKQVVSRKKSSH